MDLSLQMRKRDKKIGEEGQEGLCTSLTIRLPKKSESMFIPLLDNVTYDFSKMYLFLKISFWIDIFQSVFSRMAESLIIKTFQAIFLIVYLVSQKIPG